MKRLCAEYAARASAGGDDGAARVERAVEGTPVPQALLAPLRAALEQTVFPERRLRSGLQAGGYFVLSPPGDMAATAAASRKSSLQQEAASICEGAGGDSGAGDSHGGAGDLANSRVVRDPSMIVYALSFRAIQSFGHCVAPNSRITCGPWVFQTQGRSRESYRDHKEKRGKLSNAQQKLARQQATVRARPGWLSTLSVSHSKSGLYGTFVWVHRALNSQKRRFPARAARRPLASRRGTTSRG
jgi:hypothetical protein